MGEIERLSQRAALGHGQIEYCCAKRGEAGHQARRGEEVGKG